MNEELDTKSICSYYRNIYKRMVINFGYSYAYWLSNMDQHELVKSILNLSMKPTMHLIFINVAIRIRSNNNRNVDILNDYKHNHKNEERSLHKRAYYEHNIEKIKQYNRSYHQMKKTFSGINIFKKK